MARVLDPDEFNLGMGQQVGLERHKLHAMLIRQSRQLPPMGYDEILPTQGTVEYVLDADGLAQEPVPMLSLHLLHPRRRFRGLTQLGCMHKVEDACLARLIVHSA